MRYVKKCEKKKRRFHIGKISIFILIAFFVYLFISSKRDKSESEENINNVEENIQSTVNNVVGVTKNNVFTSNDYGQWGSGIVVSNDGYILTNEHVSGKKYENCYVVIDYNRKYKADIIWSNSDLDLAILKIDCKFEKCAILGDSDCLKLGMPVYAIGNPIGISFEKTVTSGIISGLNRNLEFEENSKKIYINNLIQIDAAINPGNSGGALIDSSGQIVGVTTIKISSADSMAFAVPINIVKPVIEKIKSTGEFIDSTIGIWGYDKYSINEIRNDIKLDSGIYVAQVNSDSTSELAGLKVGDIIVSVDDRNLEKVLDLRKYIYEKNVGDSIFLKIQRDKKVYNIEVKLYKK